AATSCSRVRPHIFTRVVMMALPVVSYERESAESAGLQPLKTRELQSPDRREAPAYQIEQGSPHPPDRARMAERLLPPVFCYAPRAPLQSTLPVEHPSQPPSMHRLCYEPYDARKRWPEHLLRRTYHNGLLKSVPETELVFRTGIRQHERMKNRALPAVPEQPGAFCPYPVAGNSS